MTGLYRVTYYWKASFEVEADSVKEAYREVDSDLQMMDDGEFAYIMDFCRAEAEEIGSASRRSSRSAARGKSKGARR